MCRRLSPEGPPASLLIRNDTDTRLGASVCSCHLLTTAGHARMWPAAPPRHSSPNGSLATRTRASGQHPWVVARSGWPCGGTFTASSGVPTLGWVSEAELSVFCSFSLAQRSPTFVAPGTGAPLRIQCLMV